MTRPVRQGSVELGTVYVQAIVEPITRRLERYGVIALLVTMASLISVMLGVAQIRLSRANERLEQQGLDLARANEELRAQIERREKAETALRQAQKMEAIGQLTGGIAHDFNNLLQVIIGNLEVLQRRDVAESDDAKRMLSAAARDAERAAVLTQRLLAFSRRQPLDPQADRRQQARHRHVRAASIARSARTIRIETVLSPGLWRVTADANQLENALLNLVVNARDAMPQGGRLTIETANAYLDEPYAHANELRAGPVRVDRGDRHRHGHDRRRAGQGIRAVFHDQGRRQGIGPRPVAGLRLHEAVGRPRQDLQRSRRKARR